MSEVYHAFLVIACVASAMSGAAILTRDPTQRSNRLASGIVFGGAWWAFCEIVWNRTTDPAIALHWIKLSALGWVAIGPLGLHLMLELVTERHRRFEQLLKGLYVAAGGFLLIDWLTPLIHVRALPMSWGFSYEFGAFYPVYYVITMAAIGAGLWVSYGAYRQLPSHAERNQARGIGGGMLVAMTGASITDGILPYFGVHVPHIGTASIAMLGVIVTWTFFSYGDSLLSPRAYAGEILETMPDGLVLLHLDGQVRHVNLGFQEMLGSERGGELVGRRIDSLLPGFEIDSTRGYRNHDCECLPFDGRPFPVMVSSSILRDRLERPSGVVLVIRDVREVVSLRQKVMISGRMAAVGQLAAGVAHEINNPMAYVRANLSQLERLWRAVAARAAEGAASDGTLAEGLELIEESIEGVDRATTIVRDIKTFSHSSHSERESVDLCALLDTAQRIARPQIKHRALFVSDYAPLPPYECAPRELQQVFLNLLLNAADAGTPESVVTVRVVTRCDERGIRVAIEDDGIGIPADLLERIFDPFFTTKEAGHGTGLGLALSYEIVRRHGGEIEVESTPDQGTRFTLVLPIGDAATA